MVQTVSEKTITIRVSEDLHKAVKIQIAEQGISLKDYIVNLIQKDLENRKK